MKEIKNIKALEKVATPFWYYDLDLLKETLGTMKECAERHGNIQIHFAVKANCEKRILYMMSDYGFGADCVSGAEVKLAISSGISPEKVLYAGVGKTNSELREALINGCRFNCESLQEIYVLNVLAGEIGRKAEICVRINPDVDAHTAKSVTSGLYSSKFGISPHDFDDCIKLIGRCPNISFTGLHFHIGSQITDVKNVFTKLCLKVNDIVKYFESQGVFVKDINLGGGLGVNYENPDENPIPDFETWLDTIEKNLDTRPGQVVHLEPGRSLIAQCCTLFSRVLFVKSSEKKDFIVLDAGMNNLIRPALYGSFHKIENLSAQAYRKAFDEQSTYDVVGPVCESSDTWGKGRMLPVSVRGDLMAIRSAGAYGASMSSNYNMRESAQTVYSDQIDSALRDRDWFC